MSANEGSKRRTGCCPGGRCGNRKVVVKPASALGSRAKLLMRKIGEQWRKDRESTKLMSQLESSAVPPWEPGMTGRCAVSPALFALLAKERPQAIKTLEVHQASLVEVEVVGDRTRYAFPGLTENNVVWAVGDTGFDRQPATAELCIVLDNE